MKRKYKVLIIVGLIVVLVAGSLIFVYKSNYKYDNKLLNIDDEGVTIIYEDNYLFFDSDNEEKALVFYPNSLVEYTSYSDLLLRIAKMGIDCFLMKMPLDLSLLGFNSIKNITNKDEYTDICLVGHDRGGVAASYYLRNNADKISGLILINSFTPFDLSSSDLDVLTIYALEDEKLNKERYDSFKKYLPVGYSEYLIDGATSDGFGTYDTDKIYILDPTIQRQIAANVIVNFIMK